MPPFGIDDDVVDRATECNRAFSCLAGAKDCLCDIEEVADDPILFIRPDRRLVCPYKVSFGEFSLCTCPVRREIFLRNGI